MDNQNKKIQKKDACRGCLRPLSQCICEVVCPHSCTLSVCILQHPQETLKLLNSARLCAMSISDATLRTGLSWPNIHRAVGRQVTAANWAVLYLGPTHMVENHPVQILNRKMKPVGTECRLEGVIALDGSWKQAKALWWRNPWLLKLKRIQLNPQKNSLRGQAKEAGLSTAEALAMVLEFTGNKSAAQSLMDNYTRLIIKPNLQ
ncbi:MAG: tRNA-uridine aminocarboxypropyltransferase [Chitinivibrionales bacterium]